MKRCFQLAQLGNGFVAPNPMVGAVLVYNDTIIGEGYHVKYGEAHAEVNCINAVKDSDKHLIAASTLYVSLEPCAHFGKTPPCADLIIKHKIPKVVISVKDNFDLVNGKGIQRLKDNNVDVITGILEDEGIALLKHFIYFHKHKQPYITLKFAQSKDNFIGIKGKEISISNVLSKRYVHKLRTEHQAILVGKNTVLSDNPLLTARHWNGKNPIRIILGKENDFNKDLNIFNDDAETIFMLTAEYLHLSIEQLLQNCYQKNIISILIEGGANVLQQFIDANAWNEVHVITSNNYLQKNTSLDTNKLIKAPIITGSLEQTVTLEDNYIQILKNTNVIFNS
jgi:diaminohydroxyphosphoribosylaminopyrimidine deaminase/5-amino-6-(5-phosphoribosylamino)uracil reductase